MIIKDLSTDTVMRSIKSVIGHADDKNLKRRMKSIDYYEGDYAQYIEPYFQSGIKLPPALPNFVKRMVSARSLVYKDQPMRHNDKYVEELPRDVDAKMRQMEKMTFLTGNMGLLSHYSDEGLNYELVPYFYPLFLEGETKESAVFYPIANLNDKTSRIYEYWSDEQHFRFDERGRIFDQDENPFGIIPMTFAKRDAELVDEYWQSGALDLVSAQESVAMLYLEMLIAARIDTLGVKYATGIQQDEPIRIGTDEIMMLPEGSTLSKLPGSDLGQIVNAIKFIIQDAATNNHLVARWSDSQANSGVQVKIENLENYEARAASVEDIWRPFEYKRFNLDRTILAAHGVNISEDYHVDFTEPETVHDPAEWRNQMDWELANGLTTKRRILQEMNPDMTNDEVNELLGEVAEEQPEVKNEQPERPKTILDLLNA